MADTHGTTEFLGYETENAEGQITALIVDGSETASANVGQSVHIAVNQTPFYAESGGQVGDTGTVTTETGTAEITDTKKVAGVFVHMAEVTKGDIHAGQGAVLSVDPARRSAIRANHSATHLLHEALRGSLGEHVAQKGSLNAPDRLRFDFSHNSGLTVQQIADVERDVNAYIRQNTAVETRLMTPDDARDLGAQALFGEKYGDEVRVLSMGAIDDADKEYSIELCGGTHVNRTGDIGLFKITSISSTAANIKRVEAVTGRGAFEYISNRDNVVNNLAASLSSPAEELQTRVSGLLSDRKSLEKEIDNLKNKIAIGDVGSAEQDNCKEINGVKFTHRVMQDTPAKNMRSIADELKKKNPSGIIALIAVNDGKAALVVSVTDDLTDNYNAVNLAKAGVSSLGGKGGGGRPDFAQGGGPDGNNVDEAIKVIEKEISNS